MRLRSLNAEAYCQQTVPAGYRFVQNKDMVHYDIGNAAVIAQ
jgi:hypothetical protein